MQAVRLVPKPRRLTQILRRLLQRKLEVNNMASAPGTGTNTGTKKASSGKVTNTGRVGNAKSATVKKANQATGTAGRNAGVRGGTSTTTNPKVKTTGAKGAFKKVAPRVKGVAVNKGTNRGRAGK